MTINLDEIKARCEAATPGKWRLGRYADHVCNGDELIAVTRPDNNYPNDFEANAVFIAAAHQDIPALVAEVERLTAQLAAARSGLEFYGERAN